MTAEIIAMRRGFVGCRRDRAFADQRYCSSHRLRWVPGGAVEQTDTRPEWVRRAQAGRLPYRVTGGSAA